MENESNSFLQFLQIQVSNAYVLASSKGCCSVPLRDGETRYLLPSIQHPERKMNNLDSLSRFCFYGLGSHGMSITMKPPFGIICFLTFVQGILEKTKSKIRYIQGIVGYTPTNVPLLEIRKIRPMKPWVWPWVKKSSRILRLNTS